MRVGPVRYARNGSVQLAYRVLGEGPPLVWIPGWFSNVDVFDDPTDSMTVQAEHLTASTSLVVWDKRGTGLSDPVVQPPSLDERMDDLRSVMDAAGVEVATCLLGASEGGPMSLLFAATYPERVGSLALTGTCARFSRSDPEYPWGFTAQEIDAHEREIDESWGDGALIDLFLGSIAHIDGVRDLYGKAQRRGASPLMAKLLWRALMDVDVREILPSVETRALVLARRSGDRIAPWEAMVDLADRLPNATLCELPPGDHLPVDISGVLAERILDFIDTDRQPAVSADRTLATVLFTDIVNSTQSASDEGDGLWRRRLDLHDEVVTQHVAAAGGQLVKGTGDGVFAVFDGPTKATRCALDVVASLATRGLSVRAGVHTGECERRGDDWSGLGVHIGARIAALAGPGEVYVTRTVRDLSAGAGLEFDDLGDHQLKGIAEPWQVLRVQTR